MEVLNELNHEGRKKISLLRNNLNLLKTLASEEQRPNIQKQLLEEVKINEDEIAATIAAFQKANLASLVAIDKLNRKELLNEDAETFLRHRCALTLSQQHFQLFSNFYMSFLIYRQKKDKESLAKMSSNVTEQLLSISRSLHDSTQRSASTLDTLGLSIAAYNFFSFV